MTARRFIPMQVCTRSYYVGFGQTRRSVVLFGKKNSSDITGDGQSDDEYDPDEELKTMLDMFHSEEGEEEHSQISSTDVLQSSSCGNGVIDDSDAQLQAMLALCHSADSEEKEEEEQQQEEDEATFSRHSPSVVLMADDEEASDDEGGDDEKADHHQEEECHQPYCSEEFTFVSGCFDKRNGCDHCPNTASKTAARQTNKSLAAKALHLDLNSSSVSI
jgi:hypothetical protein